MLRAALWLLAFLCSSTPLLASSSLVIEGTGKEESILPRQELQLTSEERLLIGRAVLGEAIGEGRLGMTAVAHVIQNRMRLRGGRVQNARSFGETVLEILQQFDAMNPRKGGGAYRMASRATLKDAGLLSALSIVDEVFSGSSGDPTGGALFYYNPNTVREPGWVEHFAPLNDRQIGNHRFVGQLALADISLRRSFGHFMGWRPVPSRRLAPGIQG